MAFNILSLLNIGDDLAVLKGFAIKAGLVLGAVGILAGGAFLFYKYSEHRADVTLAQAVAAAHSQGIADSQRDTTAATNQQLVIAIQKIADLTADTNSKMANIRVTTQVQQAAIQKFKVDATDTAADEKWANDSINSSLTDIQAASTVTTTPAPVPTK
jgi:hypothetical protein